MRCERCRAENEASATLCASCGKSVKKYKDNSRQIRLTEVNTNEPEL